MNWLSSLLNKLDVLLDELINGDMHMPEEPIEVAPTDVHPITPIIATQMPPQTMQTAAPTLDDFCTAIRDYEGSPGDANYKNNNPGNCRFSTVGYLLKYEPVKESPDGFAIFTSYAIGWMYLENLVKSKVELNPSYTILSFIQNYAPSSDGNNPTAYAQFIATQLKVSTTYAMSNFV